MAGTAASAQAQGDSGDLNVGATVAGGAMVTGTTLNFGVIPVNGQAVDANAAFTVHAVNGASYLITMSNGNHFDGSSRRMKNIVGTDYLGYGLDVDAARTIPWNATSGYQGTGTGNPQNITVYGRVPGAQTVSPGDYSDTVVITATF
jgi:spore coat protein U-like protein